MFAEASAARMACAVGPLAMEVRNSISGQRSVRVLVMRFMWGEVEADVWQSGPGCFSAWRA